MNLLKHITKEAYDFVKNASLHGSIEVYIDHEDAIIVRVWNDFLEIVYAYTTSETDPYLDCFKQAIDERKFLVEYCINVYGENIRSIKRINYDMFGLDQHGYQLRATQTKEQPMINNLIIEDYSPRYIEQVAYLYDEAYHTTIYSQMGLSFNQDLVRKARTHEAKTAFFNGELVGSYILDGSYIAELVVSPSFQNQGIGKSLLINALNEVLSKHNECFIRVERINTKALQLYLKHGFQIIGSYAEHTMK